MCTWLYLKFKEIPLWSPRGLVRANMPQQFRNSSHPTTRIILDATEIFIEQPNLPELQQMTFSNYKNHNMFKDLVGISLDGMITFVSSFFPGCISDKELTRRQCVHYIDNLLSHAPLLPCTYWGYGLVFNKKNYGPNCSPKPQ